MPLSDLPYLEIICNIQATIFVGFGILWFVDPPKAISFFEVPYPKVKSADRQAMDVMAVVYGIRDIYLGASIYAAAFVGTRPVLGWIMLAAGTVAMVDGAACKWIVGKGQGSHWSYGPNLLILGAMLIGALDWVPIY